ncbi:MAG TPA: hypothetical protein PLL88_11180 [Anaerolineaceae bacterium]|nr:hypothetical protein [Anaerolineaceae bacterium]
MRPVRRTSAGYNPAAREEHWTARGGAVIDTLFLDASIGDEMPCLSGSLGFHPVVMHTSGSTATATAASTS